MGAIAVQRAAMASISAPSGSRAAASSSGAILLLGTAVATVALTVLGTTLLYGAGEEGRGRCARYPARPPFPLFPLAFSAAALAELKPSPASFWLLRHRRWLGLSFAFVMLGHLVALLAFLATRPAEPALSVDRIVGGVGYLFILFMAATSNDGAVQWLGRERWSRLHRSGLYLLWFIFAVTYLGRVGEDLSYLPALLLAVAALGLRVAAWRRRRSLGARRASLQHPGCR